MGENLSLEEKKEQADFDLRELLRKLGLRSVREVAVFGGTLSEAQLRRMMQDVKNNFGAPDRIIMSPKAFSDYKKHFK